ncbi:MAG: putative 4-hydroxybenzoate polyprenyltransferase [Deltaproteobacteria bacterium]|nr:putative 4-hydroxybenzoate polyprenyltransferase [Deltaproteobacteria bacterium]
MNHLLQKTKYTFELVKFSHSIFALPFALIAYFNASQGKILGVKFIWVLLCLVAARTAAMAFNRLMDAPIDAQNPRTQNRHLPQGLLKKNYVWMLTLLSSLLFILSARQLNLLSFYLAPLCLLILFFYSLTKKFTHYTQFFLGLALGLAPLGAHIAVTGQLNGAVFLLASAVIFWVAGFDLLYALQDLDFDKKASLYSLAVKWGKAKSLTMAKVFHACFALLLGLYIYLESVGPLFWLGFSLSVILLFWQHLRLKTDLSNLEASFFNANGILSLILGLSVFLDWKLFTP